MKHNLKLLRAEVVVFLVWCVIMTISLSFGEAKESMSSYYREQGFHSRKRFLRRLRYAWGLLILGLLVGGGFFAYDAVQQNRQSDTPSQESKAVTSLIVSNTQFQTSPYFQFQSPKGWKAIANESRSNHFVYREYNGPLIEQELTIDINRDVPESLATTQTTYVLPVTVNASGKLTPTGSISPPCKEIIKGAKVLNATITTYKNVTFSCNPNTSNYYAVAGLVGGTSDMTLPRPDGSKAVYNISYKNLKAQATDGDFDNIVETFETR